MDMKLFRREKESGTRMDRSATRPRKQAGRLFGLMILICVTLFLGAGCRTAVQDPAPAGFVHLTDAVPDAILEIRYYSPYNFVGDRNRGYERPTALLTLEAARAL